MSTNPNQLFITALAPKPNQPELVKKSMVGRPWTAEQRAVVKMCCLQFGNPADPKVIPLEKFQKLITAIMENSALRHMRGTSLTTAMAKGSIHREGFACFRKGIENKKGACVRRIKGASMMLLLNDVIQIQIPLDKEEFQGLFDIAGERIKKALA